MNDYREFLAQKQRLVPASGFEWGGDSEMLFPFGIGDACDNCPETARRNKRGATVVRGELRDV